MLERHKNPKRKMPSIIELANVNLGQYIFLNVVNFIYFSASFTYNPRFQRELKQKGKSVSFYGLVDSLH